MLSHGCHGYLTFHELMTHWCIIEIRIRSKQNSQRWQYFILAINLFWGYYTVFTKYFFRFNWSMTNAHRKIFSKAYDSHIDFHFFVLTELVSNLFGRCLFFLRKRLALLGVAWLCFALLGLDLLGFAWLRMFSDC